MCCHYMIHDINLISIKFAILNNTLYMNTYDTVTYIKYYNLLKQGTPCCVFILLDPKMVPGCIKQFYVIV